MATIYVKLSNDQVPPSEVAKLIEYIKNNPIMGIKSVWSINI